MDSASNWDWYPEPPYIPPPYLPPPPYLSPPPRHQPFTDFTNYCPPYQYHSYPQLGESSTMNASLNSTGITSDPFFIKFLNSRIKVCAGCKGQHHKNSEKGLLSPPYDICLGHKESLSFINPKSGTECSKIGNAYYHINLECIQRKHPSFTAALVECPPDVQEKLTDIHCDFLLQAIGY